jgi:Mak10 subunit, NatC N(alpha)-terminal acetyltransferase
MAHSLWMWVPLWVQASWISGHSMAQTVLTCHWMHHYHALPRSIPMDLSKSSRAAVLKDIVLCVYVVGVQKCAGHIWAEMIQGRSYEVSFCGWPSGLTLLLQPGVLVRVPVAACRRRTSTRSSSASGPRSSWRTAMCDTRSAGQPSGSTR